MSHQRRNRRPGHQKSAPVLAASDIRVECFMLCDAVEPVNQRLYILGGGLETATVRAVSGPITTRPLVVAVRLVGPETAAGKEVRLTLEAVGPEGNEIRPPLDVSVHLSDRPSVPGAPAGANVAIEVGRLPVSISGSYRFMLSVRGQRLAETSIGVVVLSSDDGDEAEE